MPTNSGGALAVAHTQWFRVLGGLCLLFLALFLLAEAIGSFKGLRYVGSGVAATNTIQVSGMGEVFAKPDVAAFSFSATGRAATAEAAQANATKLVNRAIEYLKAQGISENDIRTTDYSISPQYELRPCDTYLCNQEQKISGYETRQMITVKVRDTSQTGKLLAGLGELGISEVSGISFTIDSPDTLQTQARDKAIAQADQKAKTLARQLRVELVRVVGFYEGDQGGPMYYDKDMAIAQSAAGSAAPDVPMGQNQIVSNIMITYEIR